MTMLADDMPEATRGASRVDGWVRWGGVLVWALGAGWAAAGLLKVTGVVMMDEATAEPVWTDRFPDEVVVVTGVFEVMVAVLLLFGRTRAGVVMGVVMLAGFACALMAWPVPEGQACGCMGRGMSAGMDSQATALARVALFASLHVLAWACVLRRDGRRGASARRLRTHRGTA